MKRWCTLALVMFLAACAINPADVSPRDPVGVGAAMNRCATTEPKDRSLPGWFAMFGPGLACR